MTRSTRGLQELVDRKDADAEEARLEREASDADWESRLNEAVNSAQKWTEFAQRLEAEKAEAESQLSSTLSHVQARSYPLFLHAPPIKTSPLSLPHLPLSPCVCVCVCTCVCVCITIFLFLTNSVSPAHTPTHPPHTLLHEEKKGDRRGGATEEVV
jgi:hypothetical protein